MAKNNKSAKFSIKQMFSVTCVRTGATVKVRKPVYEARVSKVQAWLKKNGRSATKENAITTLNANYVSSAARKEFSVDMLNNPIAESTLTKTSRRPATKPAPKAAKKSSSRKSAKKAAPTTPTEEVAPTTSTEEAAS